MTPPNSSRGKYMQQPGLRQNAAKKELAGESGSNRGPNRGSNPGQSLAADRVNHLQVGPEGEGQRLDNYLLRIAKGVPKSHVYRIVRSGEVRVNGGRASVEQRLTEGDTLRIPPLRVAEPRKTAAPVRPFMPPVLFEDEHVLAVDKPAGLAAHGGSGVSYGLIESVRAARPNQPFLELAHRLDRETSGILLLAKTRRALLQLHAQIREGQVDKRYLALVVGDWVNDRQHVKAPLHKYLTREGERRVAVDPEGQASHTTFNLRERFGAFSLVEAELHTGRTHQIRVHLAHLDFPIVGDDKYGDFELNKRAARAEFGVKFDRMFLHAVAIAVRHPISDERLQLQAELPAECLDLLNVLRKEKQRA